MNDANPFKTISSKELYENPWIRLVEDQILKPNGEPGIYGKLHFNNYALGIVAVSENMDIWLVGQYRYVFKILLLGNSDRRRFTGGATIGRR